jgi:hypothetical protein
MSLCVSIICRLFAFQSNLESENRDRKSTIVAKMTHIACYAFPLPWLNGPHFALVPKR